MVRHKRRVLAALGAAVIAGALVVSTGLAAGAGKVQIAVFYYNPSPYGVASDKAAIVEAKKLGGVRSRRSTRNNDPTRRTRR